jgi:hypothetical protein
MKILGIGRASTNGRGCFADKFGKLLDEQNAG